jgi:hypothetical protein
MTTWTLGSYDTAVLNETVVPADSGYPGNCEYVLSNAVDLRGEIVVANDVVQCLAIPAHTLVESVWIQVDTADTSATDLDFGFTSVDADGFLDGASLAATGIILEPAGKPSKLRGQITGGTGAQGIFTHAADTIDCLCNTMTTTTATTGGKFRIYAKCFTPRAI